MDWPPPGTTPLPVCQYPPQTVFENKEDVARLTVKSKKQISCTQDLANSGLIGCTVSTVPPQASWNQGLVEVRFKLDFLLLIILILYSWHETDVSDGFTIFHSVPP